MDIKKLSSLVRDLVLDSDEVVVPGLGTFRAEVVPATFSDKGYTVNPPYRKLTFVAEIPDQVGDDAKAKVGENTTALEAKGLPELVTKLKKELKEARSVELPGLGKLRLTKDDKYFFVADEEANIFPDGFGLEPVSLKNKDGEQPKKGKKSSARKGTEGKSEDISPSAMKSIWIIVGVIILAMIVLRLLGVLFPDFIDRILYSPEEFARIHHTL